jgi:hypothetical protein
LVEPQNQDRRLGGQRRDPGAPKSFEVVDTRRGRKGYTKGIFPKSFEGRSPGILPLVLQRHIPKVPLVGEYPSLGFRVILLFRLSPYILRGERMAAISRNPSSFGFPIFPSYFP